MYSDPERDVYTFLISAQKKREAPISSLYDVVCDIFLAESRYASQSSRLSQIFSSGRGIQPLINEAARILEAYIVVIDSSYQMLSMSEPPETDDAANLEELSFLLF